MRAWLYTLPECDACIEAKRLISTQGFNWDEVPINNPILELGIGMLFKDRKVHAPILVIPGKGIYSLSTSEPKQFMRIVSLELTDPLEEANANIVAA